MGPGGEFLDVHVVGQWHPTGVDVQYFASTSLAGNADLDFPIEPTAAPQGRVQRVDAVGRANDDHVPAGVEPVHQRQQLADHPALDIATVFTFWSQ